MREKDVERRLVEAVKARGGLCWKFTSPSTAGVPDRVVILPGGRIGFVEVKSPGEKPRPLQIRRLAQLNSLNVPALVLDHPDRIKEVLHAIQSPSVPKDSD